MRTSSLPFLALALLAAFFSLPAAARSYGDRELADRVERLENRLKAEAGNGGSSQGVAGLGVRLSAIEEEMRELRGMLERAEYNDNKLREEMQRFTQDADYRLQALEQGGAGAATEGLPPVSEESGGLPPLAPATATQASPPPPATPSTPQASPPNFRVRFESAPPHTTQELANDPIVRAAEGLPQVTPDNSPVVTPEPDFVPKFNSPRDLYNYGFSLMNKAEYAKAGDVFRSFIQQYPQDQLIGNVWYWLGETWYVREDYLRAADSFRQGFEAMPDGVKAPDNLLKLAKSLDLLGEKSKACVVLQQLLVKFEGGAESVLKKAEQERRRMSCS